jgi:protein SCO1
VRLTRRHLLLSAALLAACGRQKEPLSRYQAIPDFTLTAQDGGEFHSAEKLKGHIWVANFIFTTCQGPCPRMSSQMRQLQGRLKNRPDIKFVSFTVDPENDTPPVLAKYAEAYSAEEDRWFFLTGPEATLSELARENFMLGTVDGSLNHSTRFILIDRAGYVRKYYLSSEPGLISSILEDIAELEA